MRLAIYVLLAQQSVRNPHETPASLQPQLMAEQAEMQKKLHDNQAVEPGRNIVDHDPSTFRQLFQLPDRRWLHDIEDTKKYKARQKRFPSQRSPNQRN